MKTLNNIRGGGLMKIDTVSKNYSSETVKELDISFMANMGYSIIHEEYLDNGNIRLVYEKE